jgi:hypothetical protein
VRLMYKMRGIAHKTTSASPRTGGIDIATIVIIV